MAPSRNGVPAPAASSQAADEGSPVLQQLAKRVRNLRKRLRNVEEIQAKLDSGKALNADQVGFRPACVRLQL